MRLIVKIVKRCFGNSVYKWLRDFRDWSVYRWRCYTTAVRLRFLHRAVLRYRTDGKTVSAESRRPQVIVSFTSYPERIRLKGVVEGTALSLLRQSKRADMVVLWLAKDAFPNGIDDLPEGLRHLSENGLAIRFCEEMRSYKKLIPTLREWPDAVVVTADDDVYYPPEWLSGLMNMHKRCPHAVVAYMGQRISFNAEKEFLPYDGWPLQDFKGTSVLNLPIGVGGVLYPQGSWCNMITDYELAKRLAPFGDDLFFHLCCVLAGSQITAIPLQRRLIDLIPDVDAAPHLWTENLGQKRNDVAIRKIMAAYDDYASILRNAEVAWAQSCGTNEEIE